MEKTDSYPYFASPVTLQCAWLITNSKNMHGLGLAFQIACTSECDLKDVFYAAACGWSMLFLLSCCKNITLVYNNSALGNGSILHCVWIRFGLQGVMYMYGVWGWIVVRNCQCREESNLSTADSDFTDVQSLLLPPAFFPLTHPIFSLSFFTQGENEEEQNQHMKTKTWQRGEGGGGGRVGGTEEGEAISENKRAFKSKGWKLVRLLFLKNDPCVVLLLRARYILFYLPEETLRGVLAQEKAQQWFLLSCAIYRS